MSNNNHQPDPFYQNNPIALELTNYRGEAKLFISKNLKGQEGSVTFNFKNVSTLPIYLIHSGNNKPSEANYHFAVSFKPGVLSADSISNFAKSPHAGTSWGIYLHKESYFETLYFLHGGGTTTLAAQQHLQVPLHWITAEAAGGGRGSRAQLRTNPKLVAYDAAGKKGLEETSGYNFEIVNHTGKQIVPLHAGFVGPTGNMVLNDGSSNSLKLRVTNILDEKLTLTGGHITLRLETGDQAKQANLLTDTKGANAIKLKIIKDHKDHAVDKPGLGKKAGFTISTQLPATLASKGHFDIDLTGIKTTYGAGFTNLSLDYTLKGYWDHTLVCPIEKSSAVYFQDQKSLDVAGSIKTNALILTDPNHENAAYPEGGIRTKTLGTQNPQLTVEGISGAKNHRRLALAAEELTITPWMAGRTSPTSRTNVNIDGGKLAINNKPYGEVGGQYIFTADDKGTKVANSLTVYNGFIDSNSALLKVDQNGLVNNASSTTFNGGDLSIKGGSIRFGESINEGDPAISLSISNSSKKIKIEANDGVIVSGKLNVVPNPNGPVGQSNDGEITFGAGHAAITHVGSKLTITASNDSTSQIQLSASGGVRTLGNSFQIGSSTPIKQIVAGAVYHNGTTWVVKHGGNYFSLEPKVNNYFTLKWTHPLTFAPVVTVTAYNVDKDANEDNFASVYSDVKTCDVFTIDNDGKRQDAPFYFTAIWVD